MKIRSYAVALFGTALFLPVLAGCGTVSSLIISSQDLNFCSDVAAEAAKSNGGASTDPVAVMAVTTSVAVNCLRQKDFECTAQSTIGEWGNGFPKQYSCMGSEGIGFDLTPAGIANSLRDVGIPISTSLG